MDPGLGGEVLEPHVRGARHVGLGPHVDGRVQLEDGLQVVRALHWDQLVHRTAYRRAGVGGQTHHDTHTITTGGCKLEHNEIGKDQRPEYGKTRVSD